MPARSQWRIVPVILALFGATAAAHAAGIPYPTKPVRIIVPYPPGGSTDPTARAYGNWLSEKFNVPVVIDNRPGAGSTIGHALGAKATPDGYTLVLGTSGGLVVSAAFGTRLASDPLRISRLSGGRPHVPDRVAPSVNSNGTGRVAKPSQNNQFRIADSGTPTSA